MIAIQRSRMEVEDGQSWFCLRKIPALANKAAKIMASLARNDHIPHVLRCIAGSAAEESASSEDGGISASFTTVLRDVNAQEAVLRFLM